MRHFQETDTTSCSHLNGSGVVTGRDVLGWVVEEEQEDGEEVEPA
jgi:hypothetical protein